MPVDIAPSHALVRRSNCYLTALAANGEQSVIAEQTQRHVGLLIRDILLSGQRLIALIAAEVLYVERCFLRCRVLLGENQLVTGAASRDLQLDGQVATAENLSLVKEVDQVGQEFPACIALEAAGVPGDLLSSSISLDGHIAIGDWCIKI